MKLESITGIDVQGRAPDRTADARYRAQRHLMKYRLAVIGESVIDVITNAGGFLCDRSLDGWDVTVLVAGDSDPRALQILGADTLDLDSALSTAERGPAPHAIAIAIAGDLYRRDDRVREALLHTLEQADTDVLVWDGGSSEELDLRVQAAFHRISNAARAFKARALAMAGAPSLHTETIEMFRTTALFASRDLVPAS